MTRVLQKQTCPASLGGYPIGESGLIQRPAHHFRRLLVPEVVVMDFRRFEVGMRYVLLLQKLMKCPVCRIEEVLRPATQEQYGNLPLVSLQLDEELLLAPILPLEGPRMPQNRAKLGIAPFS